MKATIAREEDYRKEIRLYFNSILTGRLMSLNPLSLPDEGVINSVTFYDESEININNFCTWVTIGDVVTLNYNGNDFCIINLISKDKNVITINFSQFIYKMRPLEGNHVSFPSLITEQQNYVCCVDGHAIDPYSFFRSNKGQKLLLFYCFPTVTTFNKIKQCYFFAFEKISPSDIRRIILFSQRNVLKDTIQSPSADVPTTTIKIEFEDRPNIKPWYDHFPCKETIEFANNVFKEEFLNKFENKLIEIESYIRNL